MFNKQVKVINLIEERDYTKEAQIERLKFAGKSGRVVHEHDSHGLCYEVVFPDGAAFYDEDELVLI